MSAGATEPRALRRAALRHVAAVLCLCLTGRPRRGVLGFAPSGQTGLARYTARWKTLPLAAARVVWPALPEAPSTTAQWMLSRERGGWAVRPAGASGPPAYFTTAVPVDDQNAAFDWARSVTPDVDLKRISYAGPPPVGC